MSSKNKKVVQCFKCRKEIDLDNQIYYVFMGNIDNNVFCTECYLQDVRDATELDPSLTKIYSQNFIRMNK